MLTSSLHAKTARVTTTGLIAAFLAVCAVSVAPGSAAATPTAAASAPSTTVMAGGSGQPAKADGFHW